MAKFKPGESGNPGGRPTSRLNKLLSEYLLGRDSKDKKEREQKLVEKIYELAISGDMRAAALIWDRIEGRVKESGQSELESNGPIHFVLYDPKKAEPQQPKE